MPTILIVDDDPNNLRMLSYSLRKVGYEVITAANGQKGLDILAEKIVQLAILDLSMPVMDGLSLLKIIRSNSTLAELPVIILTASGNDRDLTAARQLGVSGFLTKPSSSHGLIDLIRQILA